MKSLSACITLLTTLGVIAVFVGGAVAHAGEYFGSVMLLLAGGHCLFTAYKFVQTREDLQVLDQLHDQFDTFLREVEHDINYTGEHNDKKPQDKHEKVQGHG